MPVPVSVPKLGNRMRAGLVAEWYQPDGAPVHAGEPICRIECDFVAFDIEAEGAGTLRHRLDAGHIRPPGDLLGVILAQGERVPEFAPIDDEPLAGSEEGEPPVPATAVLPVGAVELRPADWELPDPVEHVPGAAAVLDVPVGEQPADLTEPAAADEAEPDAHDQAAAVAETAVDFEASFLVEDDPAAEPQPDDPERWATVSPADDQPEDAAPEVPRVPFVRRFASFELEAAPPTDLWAAIPGDDQSFDAGLFPVPRDAITEAHVDPRAPGDGEEEEASPEVAALAAWLETDPETAPSPIPSEAERTWALARPMHGQVLTMSTSVNLSEALKMRDQLTREWRLQGLRPGLEDIALRAVARALAQLPGEPEGIVSISHVVDGVEEVRALPGAAFRPFRDAVNALPDGEPAPIGCVVTSYLDTAIDSATPRLLQGHRIAIALGAERQQPAWTGDFVPTAVSTLSIAFEAAAIPDAAAGVFIARVRELMESPYALLAD